MEENKTEQIKRLREKGIRESGVAYSVAAVASVLFGLVLSFAGSGHGNADWYLYLSYGCAQLAFLVAAAVYFKRTRESPKAPFARCRPKYFLAAFLLQFGLLFSLSELNGLFVGLLGKFGYKMSEVSVPSLSGWRILPAIAVIGLLPGLMEELLFRGILARNMRAGGWGLLPVLLLSGAMFSLFHGRPEQTVYQFLCGICYTLVALRAGSILPTVFAHFCNNTAVLIFTACGVEQLSALPLGAYLPLVILSSLCLAGTVFYLAVFEKRGNGKGRPEHGMEFFMAAACGLLVCAIEWIAALAMGFTG